MKHERLVFVSTVSGFCVVRILRSGKARQYRASSHVASTLDLMFRNKASVIITQFGPTIYATF